MSQSHVRKLQLIAQAMRRSLAVAANEYANGVAKRDPLVDRHFTAGNQQRYGWEPLSADYFKTKREGIVRKGGNGLFHSNDIEKFKKSKLDKSAQFMGAWGQAYAGTNLPMLVKTGRLRAAINSKTHTIISNAQGTKVTIIFKNLPVSLSKKGKPYVYAKALHGGIGMPKRSPVEPNAEDIAMVIAIQRRIIDAAIGAGAGKLQAFGGARARMV